MTGLSSVNDLAAYLRVHLAPLRKASATQAATARGNEVQRGKDHTTAGLRAPNTGAQPPADDLATVIARRVTGINAADPDRRRKAFRVFLESVLLDEWGAHLINDPGFQQLVANVQVQMESNAELQRLMNQAADQLIGQVKG